MKKLLLGSMAFVALIAGPAMAADMAVRAPVYKGPAPVVAAYNWSGFYIGGTVGGAWGTFDPTTSTVLSPVGGGLAATSVTAINAAGVQSIKPSGWTGGFEVGYNWQISNLVLGVEGDIESFRLSGSAATGPVVYPCCAPAAFNITSNASTTWLATVRGRLGVAANNWLFFVTGGAAFTNLNSAFTFTDNCGAVPACGPPGTSAVEAVSFSGNKTGYTVGGGVEAGLWGQWSVKAEYLYVNFGTASAVGLITGGAVAFGTNNNPFTHSVDLKANIVRFGLNYRFSGPVVARY